MPKKRKSKIYTFIIPVYIIKENTSALKYLEKTLNSVSKQTCHDWNMVIVDDNSKNIFLDEYINSYISKQEQEIIYHQKEQNEGAGISRNTGIEIAYSQLGSNIILYQDADDLAHPKRVELTKKAFENLNIDLVYSPFIPIDEFENKIEHKNLSFSVKKILSAIEKPPIGENVWKAMAEEKGYVNLTSTTSVRIEYARRVPFLAKKAEDTYTWMLYSAHGAVFHFIDDIPCKYRIPQNAKTTISREYIGEIKFYKDLIDVNLQAFFECIQLGLNNDSVKPDEIKQLALSFYNQIHEVLKGDDIKELAEYMQSIIHSYRTKNNYYDLPREMNLQTVLNKKEKENECFNN